MSIRRMIPMGTVQRKCIVCGYPINAKSDELTAHELQCLEIPSSEIPEKPGVNAG
jgi:predicted nucleic acid-binding Zn ribbon protein